MVLATLYWIKVVTVQIFFSLKKWEFWAELVFLVGSNVILLLIYGKDSGGFPYLRAFWFFLIDHIDLFNVFIDIHVAKKLPRRICLCLRAKVL